MLFNSFHYFVFFLGVILAVDSVRRRGVQHAILLAASFYFYWASSSFFVFLLVFSSCLDFYCGLAIDSAVSGRGRRTFLTLSLIGNLGVLAYFKYAGFAVATVAAGLEALGWRPGIGSLEVFLPVGISFFTFQSMSYTLDIYFGKLKPARSLKEFCLYVSFFPQLVAGPIVRAREFLPQLSRSVRLDWANLKFGLTLIVYGLVKKVGVADNLSGFVQDTFFGEQTHDTFVILIAIAAFAVQIYCDFSGYTDIAIGSARVLGFHFPDNFAHPYFSRNITEFWQRWHISLSTWLRDYLYIPLGGNRRGRLRQLINLMVTMLLGGLWHGAAWHFVLWGGYQGALLAIHKFVFAERRWSMNRFWNPFKVLSTFYLTCLGWLIFLIPDISDLAFYMQKMLFLDLHVSDATFSLWNTRRLELFLLSTFLIAHLASYRRNGLSGIIAAFRPPAWAIAMCVGLVAIYLLAPGQKSFIYFQF